jgi:hypothetical protein
VSVEPPAPALLAWLAIVQTIATLAAYPIARLLISLRDEIRSMRQTLSGPEDSKAEGIVSRVRELERELEGLKLDLNKLGGALRRAGTLPPDATQERTP